MSQTYNTTDTEYINMITEAFISIDLIFALTILLPAYEFVITFDQEVEAVWMRDKKLSLSSLLLVSTRWCMVMLAVMSSLPITTTSCKPIIMIITCIELLSFSQVALFSALRVSAIWGRNYTLFFVVAALGFAPVVANAYVAATYSYVFVGDTCIAARHLSKRTSNILPLVTRIPVIIADVLVLILTWIKTFKQVMNARRAGVATSVSMCLLRDGTIYFITLLALNIIQLVTNRTPHTTAIALFVVAIPPILVNRFMLNLRQIDRRNDTQTVDWLSSFSAPQFRASVEDSMFGNFGEPLEHGSSLRDEDAGEGLNASREDIPTNYSVRDDRGSAAPTSRSSGDGVIENDRMDPCIVQMDGRGRSSSHI